MNYLEHIDIRSQNLLSALMQTSFLHLRLMFEKVAALKAMKAKDLMIEVYASARSKLN